MGWVQVRDGRDKEEGDDQVVGSKRVQSTILARLKKDDIKRVAFVVGEVPRGHCIRSI